MNLPEGEDHIPRRAPGTPTSLALRCLARGALLGSLLVAGACTAAEPVVIGDPYDAPSRPIRGREDVQPRVGWVDVGRRLYVTTWGSSSCPLAPTALSAQGETVQVTMTGTGGPDCTADVAANSYAIDVPEQLRGTDRLQVVLVLGRGGSVELVLDRGA